MALNIKNERVHELAREAAHLTGKTQTSVIEQALEELLARHLAADDEAARWERVTRILDDMHALIGDKPLMDHNDLYDEETGLPR